MGIYIYIYMIVVFYS